MKENKFMEKVSAIFSKVKNPAYYRYYLAAVVFFAMMLVFVKCTGSASVGKDPMAGAYQSFTNDTEKNGKNSKKKADADTKKADGTEESSATTITELIQKYYKYYADADLENLKKIAEPISDREASYIQFFSQYVEEYQNITVYTKRGLDDTSYLVSVEMEIKFKDINTAAPGLDFFYVRTRKDGSYYIDNLYSTFNISNGENDMDPDVTALIATFEQQKDLVALQTDVKEKFSAALMNDEGLSNFLNTTLPDETTKWSSAYQAAEAQRQADLQNATTMYAIQDIPVKDSPAQEGADLGTITAGTAVTKYADEGAFSRIDYNGANAYVESQYLAAEAPAPAPAAEESTETTEEATPAEEAAPAEAPADDGTTTVSGLEEGSTITMGDTLKMRADASTDSEQVDTAYVSETVTIIANYSNGWTKIKNVRGKEGFVKTEYLQ